MPAKWVLIGEGTLALLAAGALALPVKLWRTGQVPLPDLAYSAAPDRSVKPLRVWVDADAACGTGQHRDPDDCLALLSLATDSGIGIAGVSTVLGNAPVSETDAVMRSLVQELGNDTLGTAAAPLPVFKGCGAPAPRCLDDGGSLAAQEALRRALHEGALDIVALWPWRHGSATTPCCLGSVASRRCWWPSWQMGLRQRVRQRQPLPRRSTVTECTSMPARCFPNPQRTAEKR